MKDLLKKMVKFQSQIEILERNQEPISLALVKQHWYLTQEYDKIRNEYITLFENIINGLDKLKEEVK